MDFYEFDLKTVMEYRKKDVGRPSRTERRFYELTKPAAEEAERRDMDWEEEVLGEYGGGC